MARGERASRSGVYRSAAETAALPTARRSWRGTLKIVDFGLARNVAPDSQAGNEDDLVIEDGYVIQGGPLPPS